MPGESKSKKSRSDVNRNGLIFVPWTGLEPARRFQHYPLKIACLPIPPPGQQGSPKYNEFYVQRKWKGNDFSVQGKTDIKGVISISIDVHLFSVSRLLCVSTWFIDTTTGSRRHSLIEPESVRISASPALFCLFPLSPQNRHPQSVRGFSAPVTGYRRQGLQGHPHVNCTSDNKNGYSIWHRFLGRAFSSQ